MPMWQTGLPTGKCPWEKTGVDRTGLFNVWVAIKERNLSC